MIKAWHYIFYSLYKLLCKASLIITYPIRLLYRLPAIKKYHSKKGYNPEELYDDYRGNRELGVYNNIYFSFLIMHFLLVAILIAIFNLILITFNIFIEIETYLIVSIVLLAFLLNNFILLRDNYDQSFLEFDTYNKIRKRRGYVFSYIFIIIVLVLFYLSIEYGGKHHL